MPPASRSIMPSRQTLIRRCSKAVASRSTASTSPRRRAEALRGRRRRPGAISFAGPGKRDAELEAAIAAGVTLNLESEGEAERALAIGERARRDAAAGGPGQSRFRDQGLGHADGRRRQAVRRRCRARAGAGPRGSSPRAPSGAASTSSPAARRSTPRRSSRRRADARARRRSSPRRPARRRRWSISAAASAFPISTATQPLDVDSGRRGAGRGARATRRRILADTELRDRARPLAGRRGGRLSDPDRRPQGQPRQDLPGHRRRPAPPARRPAAISARWCAATIRSRSPPASTRRPRRKSSIVGCLCTPLDRLADEVMMPRAEVGDLVAVFWPAPMACRPARRPSSASRRRGKCSSQSEVSRSRSTK